MPNLELPTANDSHGNHDCTNIVNVIEFKNTFSKTERVTTKNRRNHGCPEINQSDFCSMTPPLKLKTK